jgi:hypothetical protein
MTLFLGIETSCDEASADLPEEPRRLDATEGHDMDEKRFWDIISVGCPHYNDPQDWSETLEAEVRKLSPGEIAAFDLLFDDKTNAAYSHDLWGAAYLINGGASDDGFYYFRCWLVGMGKKVYDAALADPDSLAEVVLPEEEYEAEIYGVGRAACGWHGVNDAAYDKLLAKVRPRATMPPRLKGSRWEFGDDAKVRRRFPCLAALYLRREDQEPEWLDDALDAQDDEASE